MPQSDDKMALKMIEALLRHNRSTLAKAADTIRLEDVSNYPIMVAAQNPIELGIPLIEQGQLADDWCVNASTLEDFYAKKIIDAGKVDNFRTLYKQHANDLCVFVLFENEGRFIFIPA